ncbi:helix-turn-helix domain-containing protein [Flavobacterium taihuense]|uniref:Helix-turn-helix domain-containing protein n=1 Tax=Flavobacterium taihuense TaxID=2857508 RepID=A0ABS6XVG9_9FLAO|nr:helix-turn-helix domain-containing protein [Flavobacterium taihuense]MBW4360680.1 helix-turn-helix domain-containing protein [Flavobacterium taihuense]
MEQVFNFETINDYNVFNNHETLHPLVSVIDFSKANPRTGSKMNFGLFCIVLKQVNCGDLKYGRNYYDYQEGTLVFISPGQTIDVENKVDYYQPIGHALVFHPDLIRGTSLAKSINDYNFFSYNTSEALHLSEKEKQLVFDCFAKIEAELKQSIDKHSKKLIASNIELFLNYCERFYDRQFITRDTTNKGILEKFEELLNGYFSSDKPNILGLPSVAYYAAELNLSANYFGDLIKKETGKSAQEYIQNKIIDVAKNKIFDSSKTINEVAYELGFKYPQHFTRFFKQHVGNTPNEYRSLN